MEVAAPPGTHTVLTGDANIFLAEADAIVQANFNEDLPKHKKGRQRPPAQIDTVLVFGSNHSPQLSLL